MRIMILAVAALILATGKASAQGPGIETILPPDHLLESLPWMTEEGKIESRGLFDFADLRGSGRKDLLLIYRQSVPVSELDKPHNQILAVCFEGPAGKRYKKDFQDDGGPIQWVRLLKGSGSNPFLFVLRDDLQGGQRLKAFTFQGDNLKQVLDAPGKKFHVRFQEGSGPLEVLSSSKEVPAGKKDAERSYRWDAGAGMFSGADPSKPVVASAGKEKAPAGMPPAEKAPQEIEIAASAGAPPAGPADMEPAASPAPKAVFAALKAEIPGLIQKGQIAVVGQRAKTLFEGFQAQGVAADQVASMRSSYYATVASALLDGGNAKDAGYYLNLAHKLEPGNPDVTAVKERMK